ncbi:DEAD/DEAH box helicase [Virgibacillus sp. 179-BFC.A HS]|uniref:DEAD/DEAH box helicase n=1 Tax=Tigheibacillus jepli TaxID=3035914 RepID=A0ABU5CGT6_9BACI|nr:DEAD/DEAH box helicase [Virgibacillus sp. 179-BFC.A HS]MDY0405553.1 DEAD/DEAH box helicase [Virgibacillus sp. 179-BFC.A HS]
MEKHTFQEFALTPEVQQIIKGLQFAYPTEIQSKVIPAVLQGKNIIGQSQTGSGKTHAYLLPLFNQLSDKETGVQFVITAPTRELATQIHAEVKKMIQLSGKEEVFSAKLLIGGTDKQRMAHKLKMPPQIIVGTPGRILDMVKDEALSIFSAASFVVDEADLMLDLGFINDVDQLLVRCKPDVQLLVFSATIPEKLQHFFKKYLQNPLYVKIENELSPETMQHRLVVLRHRDEASVIMQIAGIIHPYMAIIFTNGKEQADKLYAELNAHGLSVGLLHGGLAPRERKRVLKDIENLRYEYLVATDLASRGIDIKGVSHVINAQLPMDEDFYIHRVGRTARAGMEGMAISLYKQEDLKLIAKLEEKGLTFIFSDIANGQWQEAKHWNKRNLRPKTTSEVEKEAWKQVRKTKKVKPGYKKKMKKEQEAIKRKLIKKNKRNKYKK